ncbi:MAG: addiction module toxin RelE [Candidatus Nomurabacteria bacterium]|nr:addiction module toxin RelE [Candidatus Nomurabacteria bacterium]
MYIRHYTKAFKKSIRKLDKSGNFNRAKVESIVTLLSKGKGLSQQYKDHALKGEWLGYRECHLEPDLLLIYTIQENILILLLVDIGSHSQLFG